MIEVDKLTKRYGHVTAVDDLSFAARPGHVTGFLGPNGALSLGMRQRLGLAAALLGDPQVLILDEPANGLDPEGIAWLRGFLRELAAQGRTVLLSSHVLAEAAQTVDHVVVIDHGRLVTQSSLAELTARAAPVIRIRTPSPAQLQAAVLAGGGHARAAGPDQVEVTGLTPERAALLAAKEQIPIIESSAGPASLEDVFFRLTSPAGKDTP